jgi:excisionase family DNA binding protein
MTSKKAQRRHLDASTAPASTHQPHQGSDSEVPAWVSPLRDKLDQILDILRGKRKPVLTVGEVAQLVGRTPYTVRRWIAEGRLRARKVEGGGAPRGRLLIERGELDRLLAQGLGGDVSTVDLAVNA